MSDQSDFFFKPGGQPCFLSPGYGFPFGSLHLSYLSLRGSIFCQMSRIPDYASYIRVIRCNWCIKLHVVCICNLIV
jgi:hypothetical protein